MKKLHNPKSNMPAVYIPCWLIQVSHHELSYGAKLLYGRLAQWSNTLGIVFRSAPQLAKELSMGVRTIERFINELKDCNLIGTFQPQAGGMNHFEFYDHEWMHRPLIKELGYEDIDPPPNLAVPPASLGGTPPPNLAGINIKEIKEIKTNNTISEKTLIANVIEDNPHEIPPDLIQEWKTNRKRYPITKTVWSRLNKVLTELRDRGINPHDAFERMVANGWRSIEVSYFDKEIKALGGGVKPSQWSVDAVFNA